MNAKHDYITQIENIISEFSIWWSEIPESSTSKKPNSEKWSKKEILGHLIDSAMNNIPRIVRGQFESLKLQNYSQDDWVRVQNYNGQSGEHLLKVWVLLNKHFLRVIEQMDPDDLNIQCELVDEAAATLGWLIEDYIGHLKHHLEQIYRIVE